MKTTAMRGAMKDMKGRDDCNEYFASGSELSS